MESDRRLSDDESHSDDEEMRDSDSVGEGEGEDEDEGITPPIAISDDEMEVETESDVNALQSLEAFINTLDASQKRKVPEDEEAGLLQAHAQDDRAWKKRVVLREVTQVGTEGEFAAQPGKLLYIVKFGGN